MTKACIIKIQNFEGPFDLLFHLFEKNRINIYDIPINDITDQYMEYLFDMQKLDLEIASEFLVMAATLLHIKSKMLLPDRTENRDEEPDPREALVTRLVEYKRYKELALEFEKKEEEWGKVYYKLPELIDFVKEEDIMELMPCELKRIYLDLTARNRKKLNLNAGRITQIIEHEKVTLRSKIKEVLGVLKNRTFFIFSEIFPLKMKTRVEVVTGFLAILELTKLKRAKISQKRQFSNIYVYRNREDCEDDEKDNMTQGRYDERAR